MIHHGVNGCIDVWPLVEMILLTHNTYCMYRSLMPRLNVEKLIEVLMRVSDGLYTCWQECMNVELCESINVERERVNRLVLSLRVLVDEPDE